MLWNGGIRCRLQLIIGTNSVRLLIASGRNSGRQLSARSFRLGYQVGAQCGFIWDLDEQAMARTFRVLEDYRDELTKYPWRI